MKILKLLLLIPVFILQIDSLSARDAKEKPGDTLNVKTNGIVITATRIPEKILEIPLAVSVIPREELINRRGYGLDEVLSQTPGVLAQSRYGSQDIRITIRGFGARGAGDRSNAGTSRGIKVFMDGIPETEPDGRTSFDNIDISLANKIEVVRSNSSSLWGNAAGGVVSVTSMPVFSKPFLGFSAQAGSYGYNKFILESGTLLGGGRLSAALSGTGFSGYRENSGGERYIANIGILTPVSETTLLGVYLLASSNRFNVPGPLTIAQYDSMPTMANPVYLSRKERRFNRQGRIGFTLEHNFDGYNNLSFMTYVNPKYLQRSERGTFRDFNRYHTGGSLNYSYIANINSDIKNSAMLGLDESYQDGAILFYNLTKDAERGNVLQQNKAEGANSFGAYFQDEIGIADRLSIIIGGRYDNISYYSQDFTSLDKSEKKAFEHFTPKAGLSYRLTESNSLYMNVGGGIEVPAGNETDPAPGADTVYLLNPLLEPIQTTTYEFGSKNYLELDGILQNASFDAALYMINVKNDIIPYSGGKFYFTAGKTRRTGAEIGLSLGFDYGISLSTALTYSINEYVDYSVDSVHYGKPGAMADYSGKTVAGLPNMYYNASLRFAPGFLMGFYAEASALGVGNYFADDANKYEVPSYNIINLTAGIAEPINIVGGVSVRGFVSVNNVLDVKYSSSAFINPDIDKTTKLPMYLEPGLPRNFVAGVSVLWQ